MKTTLKLTAIASVAILLTACGGGGGGGGGSVADTPAPATPSTPAPATPSTPAPATPSTPAPATPSTPAPATPSTPAPATPSTPAPATPSTPAPVISQDQYGNQLGIAAPYVMNNSTFVKEKVNLTLTSAGTPTTYDSGWSNTAYTERTLQESWINGDVQAAWAAGWTGKGQKIGIIDDFTANDSTEVYSGTVDGVTVSIPFTHGQLVSAIAGGKLSSINFSGTAGSQTFTGTYSFDKPIYGVAKDANVYRNDFLTHQGTGLFDTMKGWSDNNHALWKSLTVVNLSLGANISSGQTYNALYNANISTANATVNVPDAVFVKAAGNEGGYASADFTNSVLVNSTAYGNKTLIVGALDQTGALASYSNRAGSVASIQNRFLVADGSGLADTALAQGTSFAAPRVAGYAAIVRHKFAALDAPTTATHLLNTAKWNSAWGTKNATTQAIYGQGEASLSQALAPTSRLR